MTKQPVLVDPRGNPLARSTATSLTASQLDAIIRRERGETGSVGEPARAVSWYYACIAQTAQAFASMPPKLWERSAGRRGRKPGYAEVEDHRAYRVLERPHPQMTGMEWRERWATILLDCGDVFCVPDKKNAPDGMTRALPLYGRDRIRPVRDGRNGPLLAWEFRPSMGTESVILGLDEVLHWRLPNPYDDVMGLAPKDSLRMALDGDFARSVFDKSFYQNGANPSAILKYKLGELDERQREEVRQTWEEYHQGPGRAGRVAVLGGDWEFAVWSTQHSQNQFIDSRKLAREEIAAAFFGFPVGFLNAQENGGLSRAGEEMDRLKFYENCVFPMVRRFEPEFNYGVIQKIDRKVVMALDTRMVPVALVYARQESEIFQTYVKNGVSANAVITALDLSFDPIEGGDVGLVQDNMAPLPAIAEREVIDEAPEAEEAQPPAVADAEEPVDDDEDERARALVSRLRTKVKRILYGIRSTSMRVPQTAEQGASVEQWREWARLTLPVMAAGVRLGADPAAPAPTERDLELLQAQVGTLDLGPALNAACERQTRRLLGAFNTALIEAARSGDPATYCRQLDQVSKTVAERAVHAAIAAGRAAQMMGIEEAA